MKKPQAPSLQQVPLVTMDGGSTQPRANPEGASGVTTDAASPVPPTPAPVTALPMVNPGISSQLAREKDELTRQIMMLMNVNETLNETVERQEADGQRQEVYFKDFVEGMEREMKGLREGKGHQETTLVEQNATLESQIKDLEGAVTTAALKEASAVNQLDRNKIRLDAINDTLQEQLSSNKALHEKLALLETTKDVLESELEAVHAKASVNFSSPVKKRVESNKPSFLEVEANELKVRVKAMEEELEDARRNNRELEMRLLGEEDGDEAKIVRELQAKNEKLAGQLKAQGELEATNRKLASQLVMQNNVSQSALSTVMLPSQSDVSLREELQTTRMEAERWQKATLAAVNVARAAADDESGVEDGCDGQTADFDVIMKKIDALGDAKADLNERMQKVELENAELLGEVEILKVENEKQTELVDELTGQLTGQLTGAKDYDDAVIEQLKKDKEGQGQKIAGLELAVKQTGETGERLITVTASRDEVKGLNESLMKRTAALERDQAHSMTEMAHGSAERIALQTALENCETERERVVASLKQQLAAISKERDDERRVVGRLSPQLTSLESTKSESEQLIASLQQQLDSASSELLEARNNVSRMSPQLTSLKATSGDFETEVATLKMQLRQLEADKDELESAQRRQLEEILQVTAVKDAQEQSLAILGEELKLKTSSETRSRRDSVEEVGRIEIEYNSKISSLSRELAKAEQERERLGLKCTVNDEELEELRKQVHLTNEANKLFKTSNSKMKVESERLKEEKVNWVEERERREKEKNESDDMVTRLRGELRDKKKEEAKRTKERDGLKEKVDDLNVVVEEFKQAIEELELGAEQCLVERGELKRKGAEIEAVKRKLGECEKRREGLEEEREVLKSSESELRGEVHALKLEGEEVKARLGKVTGEVGELGRENKRLVAAVERDGRSWKAAVEDKGRLEGEVGKLEVELEEEKDKGRRVGAELEGAKKELKYLEGAVEKGERGEAEREELSRELAGARDELRAEKARLGAKEREVGRLVVEVERMEREIGETETEREREEGRLAEEAKKWRDEYEAEKRLLRMKEGELRTAAISAQNSEIQVGELTDALSATSVDFGLRMKELEDDVRELKGRLGEKERELIGVRVRVEGEEGKARDMEEEVGKVEAAREKLEGEVAALERRAGEAEGALEEVKRELSKERLVRDNAERREKSVKGDCEVLGGELVEMGGAMEGKEKELAEVKKELRAERGSREDKEIECRKLKEWCRLRDERGESEVRKLKSKVGELEAEKRMVEGEKKGLKMELRRSRIGGMSLGGGGGGSRLNMSVGDIGRRTGGGIGGLDTNFSPMKGRDLEARGEGESLLGLDGGWEEGEDSGDDLVERRGGLGESRREKGAKEKEVARSLRAELDRSYNM